MSILVNTAVLHRSYSVQEVRELVELLRHNPDLSPEKFSGMLELVQILAHFETMTDDEIASEVRNKYRNS
jgi:hypothetical protein|nr:hypothetical protein [uncultured Flavobacterium sp.]